MYHMEQYRQLSSHIRDLNMHNIGAKFVLTILNPKRKAHLVELFQDLHQQILDDSNFMSRLPLEQRIGVQMIFAVQSPTSSRSKRANHIRTTIKSMLIIFFDTSRLVYHQRSTLSTTSSTVMF